MAAQLELPLAPAFTDADWAVDFSFYVGDLSTADDFTGSTGRFAMVRRGLPAAAVEWTSAGSVVTVVGGVFSLRVAASVMADLEAGTYDFELRRINGGTTEAMLVGEVTVVDGRSVGAAAGGAFPGAGGPDGSVQIVRDASGVQIVRGGQGPMGADATPVLDLSLVLSGFTAGQDIAGPTFGHAQTYTGVAGYAPNAPTTSQAFAVKVGAATVATISFANGAHVPTISFASGSSFTVADGDFLHVIAPSPLDAALTTVSLTLKAA